MTWTGTHSPFQLGKRKVNIVRWWRRYVRGVGALSFGLLRRRSISDRCKVGRLLGRLSRPFLVAPPSFSHLAMDLLLGSCRRLRWWLKGRCPFHWLADSRQTILTTGKWAKQEVAVFVRRVPTLLNCSQIWLTFVYVLRIWLGHYSLSPVLRSSETFTTYARPIEIVTRLRVLFGFSCQWRLRIVDLGRYRSCIPLTW